MNRSYEFSIRATRAIANGAARYGRSHMSTATETAPVAEEASARGGSSGGGRAFGLAVFGTMVVTTLGLGTWQLSRYNWKVQLLEDRRTQLAEEPIDLSDGSKDKQVNQAALGCRRVSVTGRYDYANEVHVTPRTPPKDAPPGAVPPTSTGGYLAITPLVRPDGSRLLVLRGWVPHAKSGSAGGKGQQPGMWGVKHYPERREFSWMDLPAMAQATGCDGSPLFMEAVSPLPIVTRGAAAAPSTAPLTKQLGALAETHVMPMTHIMYGGTWYALAAFGAAITYTKFFRASKGAARRATTAAADAVAGPASGTRMGRGRS